MPAQPTFNFDISFIVFLSSAIIWYSLFDFYSNIVFVFVYTHINNGAIEKKKEIESYTYICSREMLDVELQSIIAISHRKNITLQTTRERYRSFIKRNVFLFDCSIRCQTYICHCARKVLLQYKYSINIVQ